MRKRVVTLGISTDTDIGYIWLVHPTLNTGYKSNVEKQMTNKTRHTPFVWGNPHTLHTPRISQQPGKNLLARESGTSIESGWFWNNYDTERNGMKPWQKLGCGGKYYPILELWQVYCTILTLVSTLHHHPCQEQNRACDWPWGSVKCGPLTVFLVTWCGLFKSWCHLGHPWKTGVSFDFTNCLLLVQVPVYYQGLWIMGKLDFV